MSLSELTARLDPESSKQEYQVGEKAFAFHESMFYEARVSTCVMSEMTNSGAQERKSS